MFRLGYTIADVLAKPIFRLYIYAIAKAKTKADQDLTLKGVATSQPALESVANN